MFELANDAGGDILVNLYTEKHGFVYNIHRRLALKTFMFHVVGGVSAGRAGAGCVRQLLAKKIKLSILDIRGVASLLFRHVAPVSKSYNTSTAVSVPSCS